MATAKKKRRRVPARDPKTGKFLTKRARAARARARAVKRNPAPRKAPRKPRTIVHQVVLSEAQARAYTRGGRATCAVVDRRAQAIADRYGRATVVDHLGRVLAVARR